MCTVQEKIKNDLKTAMINKDNETKDCLRIVIGEFTRQPKKELSDNEAISIIQKLIKNEKELLTYKENEVTSKLISVLEKYIPEEVDNETVISWIKENIDFSTLKNKMQAMGIIMKQFGKTVDGNNVKRILNEMEDS